MTINEMKRVFLSLMVMTTAPTIVKAGPIICNDIKTMFQDSQCCGKPNDPVQCTHTLSIDSPELSLSEGGVLTLDLSAATANTAAIAGNDAAITVNNAAITVNNAAITANNAAIAGIDDDIAGNNADIAGNNADIAANIAAITGINSLKADKASPTFTGTLTVSDGITSLYSKVFFDTKHNAANTKTVTFGSGSWGTDDYPFKSNVAAWFATTVKMSGDLYIMNTASRLDVNTLLVAQKSVELNNACPTCYTNTYGLVTFGRGRLGHDGSTYVANSVWPFACNDKAYFGGEWTEIGGNFRMLGGSDKEMIVGGTGAGGYLKEIKLVANDINLYAENAGNIRMFGGVDLYGGIHFNYGSYGASDAKPSFHIGAKFGAPVTIGSYHIGGTRYSANPGIEFFPSGGQHYMDISGISYIRTSARVQSEGAWVTSDRRIKNNIVTIPDAIALEKFRGLEPKYYNYKGNDKSDVKQIGFIAQEVREAIPEAVYLGEGFVPDEQRVVEVLWQEVVNSTEYTMELSSETLAPGKYKFKFSDDSVYTSSAKLETLDGKTFLSGNGEVWTSKTNHSEVELYGSVVDDFHYISKDKIFTIAYAALQQVDKTQQALLATVAALEARLALLEN